MEDGSLLGEEVRTATPSHAARKTRSTEGEARVCVESTRDPHSVRVQVERRREHSAETGVGRATLCQISSNTPTRRTIEISLRNSRELLH